MKLFWCLSLLSVALVCYAADDVSDPSMVAYVCPFELNNCGFTIVPDSQFTSFSWKAGGGLQGDPWTKTGPMVDHTFETSQGQLMYTDSVHGGIGSKTKMTSPVMSCSGDQCCLEFFYHLFGQGMGALDVYITHPIFGKLSLASFGGESLGSQWRRHRVTFSPLGTIFQIDFEATRSYGKAIIAVDDIIVYQEGCPIEPTVYSLPYSCDFSDDMCGMISTTATGDFSWSFQNGTTLSSSSGPTRGPKDETYFMYTESAGRSRQRAILFTPKFDVTWLTSLHCLEINFYYHMNGSTMGALAFSMLTGSDSTQLFSRSGSIGDQWLGMYVRVNAADLPASAESIQFYFEANNVTSPNSNMAIAEFSVVPVICGTTTCTTETKLNEALINPQKNLSFSLLPGNTSDDCINSCLTSTECLAATYDQANANNCTHFFDTTGAEAIVTGIASAKTVTKRCPGQAACSVVLHGEYQIDGSISYSFKPVGTPGEVFHGDILTPDEENCKLACSSRYDCVAVSYFVPYNGTCEIYTAAGGASIIDGVVQWEAVPRRRGGFPAGCPSVGAGMCGLPPMVADMVYPSFNSIAEGAVAYYGCNNYNSILSTGGGTSTCQADGSWTSPGTCKFQGICNNGASFDGMTEGPSDIGSLAYVFPSAMFTCEGILERWQVFARNIDVPVYLAIWAPGLNSTSYRLIGYNKFVPKVAGLQYFIPETQLYVYPGYVYGFHYESIQIPYFNLVLPNANTLNPSPWTSADLIDVAVGFLDHDDFKIGSTTEFTFFRQADRLAPVKAFVVSPKNCEGVPTTPGGQVVIMSQANQVGSEATFECRGNYKMSGSSVSTCMADGTWTDAPICTHPGHTSGCGDPPSIEMGSPKYSSTSIGSLLEYTCSEGFVGGVVKAATCQPDSTWGPDIPTCSVSESCAIGPTVIDSSNLPKPSSLWLVILNQPFTCAGRLRRWTYWSRKGGARVYFGIFAKGTADTADNVAFSLVGVTSLYTQATNSIETYDLPDNTVIDVAIGHYVGIFYDFPNHDSGLAALPSAWSGALGSYAEADLSDAWVYPYGATQVIGATKFEFTSASYRTAYRIFPLRASLIEPPLQCSPPPSISNGDVSAPSVAFGAVATYTCTNNYVMVGSNTMTCETLGYWSPAVPVCEVPDSCSVGVAGNQDGLKLDTYLRIFSDMTFGCDGEVRRWKFFAQTANIMLYLGVWRQDSQDTNKWQLVGFNEYSAAQVGNVIYDVPLAQRVIVKSGDAIGIHYNSPYFGVGNAVIHMVQNVNTKGYEIAYGDGDISLDKIVTFAGQTTADFYTPSIFASVVPTSGCTVASAPLYGNVNQPDGTSAVYSCDDGFELLGSSTATCTVTGQWPPKPYCVGKGGCTAGLGSIDSNTTPFATLSPLLHVFTTLTFPCAGKVIGWAYISATTDHAVYLGAWRNEGSGKYTLIGYNKVWATEVGYNYEVVESDLQFAVAAGDMLGIYYPSYQLPMSLMVIPYAGVFERNQQLVSSLESGFTGTYGAKQLSVGSTVEFGYNVRIRWRTPQVQAIVQS